jgi:hypothetical protein
MEQLEDSRALEMVARCAVETGAATFYTALQACAPEPVLKVFAGFIRCDEVGHYNYFRSFYEAYQTEERVGRLSVLRALRRRFPEAEQERCVHRLQACVVHPPSRPAIPRRALRGICAQDTRAIRSALSLWHGRADGVAAAGS